ncbi:MAG: cytidylate kinase-like family protein [Bacteroidales bacterium]|nr:cytidylate kinase-like family protein [Bacteroidales bacterium]
MNTKKPFVITISREVGSGGHTIGKILAQELGVRYCDKLLVESLEKQFGLTKSGIEKLKGQKKNWLADFLNKVAPLPSAQTLGLDPKYTQEFKVNVTTDDIYKAEVEILTEFANMGSCVIAGRSGFFVLKDHPNILNVFITASMEYRIQRVMKKQNLNEESALAVINGIDAARENYTKRYAGVSRYDTRNYHLALSADNHTEEEIAKLILDYIR